MSWYYEKRGTQAGPISDEELLDLHARSAVTDSTLVWRDGMSQWKTMREAGPRPRPEHAAAPQANATPEVFARARLGTAVREGAGLLFSRRGGMILLGALVVFLIYGLVNLAPFVSLVAGLLMPVLVAGLLYYILRFSRGESPGFEEVFSGFSRNFVQLFLLGLIYVAAQIVATLLGVLVFFVISPDTFAAIFDPALGGEDPPQAAIVAGVVVYVLPLIYFLFAVAMAPLFLVDRKSGVMAGLRNSFVAVHQNFFTCAGWYLASVVLVAAAFLTGMAPVLITGDDMAGGMTFLLSLGLAFVLLSVVSLASMLVLVILYRDASAVMDPGAAR